jgi:hypothetical protein
MEYFRFGVKLALVFFLLGTLILVLFAITLSARVALFAYQFTITAILINWSYAAMLLFYLLKRRISLNILFKTLGAMFVNIPVGLLYAWLMVYFLSFARITISNTSGEDLGPIRIEGCEQKEIEELRTGESKTLWIKIPGDCSIEIQYEMENASKRDTLVKYITPGGGLKVNYELRSGQ